MRARKCKRGRGGCGRLCGRWVLAGASFGPMAAISRRGQGGRIYNNTRVRELLRRKCVKPADLTTHSPPKTSAPPPAQRHALPEHFCSPPQPRRTPTQCRRTPAGCAMHARRPHNPFPAEDFLSPPHSDTPSPSTSAPHAAPTHAHAAPTHARRLRDPFPADLTTHSPPKLSARPRTATRPSRALPLPHAAPTHARRLCDAFPADPTIHSPQRHAASPSVPLRAQKNGTAQCMCDAECLGRPSLRSVIWVGEPRAVRHRCGALACRRGA